MDSITKLLAEALREACDALDTFVEDGAEPYREALVAYDAQQDTERPTRDALHFIRQDGSLATYGASDEAKKAPSEFDLAEPWGVHTMSHPLFGARFLIIADAEVGNDDAPIIASCRREENAARITACVNACAGIPTDTLEFLAPVGLKAIADKWGGV